jgi:surfactin synthase thioesterase subunit
MPEQQWFLSHEIDSSVPHIFCFHHAGGSPRTFLGWQPDLDGSAQIVPICMPGRDYRADEPVPESIAELADGAAAAIAEAAGEQPFYLFGHSLGALVAFEVARRLRDMDNLRHLVASGSNAPARAPSARTVQIARLEGREFAEAMSYFGGIPPEAVADDDLRRLLLPGLQADFQLSAEYRYRSAAPLTIGISLINGVDDPHVKAAGLEPWSRESTSPPDHYWVDGGHFYFMNRCAAVTDVLLPLVRGSEDLATPAGHHVELI